MLGRSARYHGLPEVFPAPRQKVSPLRPAVAATVLLAGSVAVLGVAGIVALGAHETLLFPSLGPTAMLFFARPLPPETSVGTTVLAHWIGIVVGLGCLLAFGLRDDGAAVDDGLTGTRVAAAALSVGLTAAALRLLKSPHAPAGASTLIVSLGLLTSTMQLTMMALSVVLVALVGWAANLVVGVRVPWWPNRAISTGDEVGEQVPLPWKPAVRDAGASTTVMKIPDFRGGPPPG